ncbi:MAG: hypothetical protein PHY54_17000 [Methylococcales bacterium]|nr:hypothetical protein [Methylococcales bacterium]
MRHPKAKARRPLAKNGKERTTNFFNKSLVLVDSFIDIWLVLVDTNTNLSKGGFMIQLDIFEIFSINRELAMKLMDETKKLSNVIAEFSKLFCGQVKSGDKKWTETGQILKALRLRFDKNRMILFAWWS